MLGRDFMIRADNRAFEEAPDALYGIGMNIAAHPFLVPVGDCLMPCILVSDATVTGPFIIRMEGYGCKTVGGNEDERKRNKTRERS